MEMTQMTKIMEMSQMTKMQQKSRGHLNQKSKNVASPSFLRLVAESSWVERVAFTCKTWRCQAAIDGVERVFSQVNMVKTKVTNRLHASTVANRLLARQYLVRQDKQCYNWTPSQELIDTVALRFGQCHSRYTARLNNASQQNSTVSTVSTITLSDYDVVGVVDSA